MQSLEILIELFLIKIRGFPIHQENENGKFVLDFQALTNALFINMHIFEDLLTESQVIFSLIF